MFRKLLPHPLLSVALTVVWLLLLNNFSLGGLLLGAILGLLIPLATQRFWPDRATPRGPLKIAGYVLLVLWDIVVANVVVAKVIVFKPNRRLAPCFVTIPLDLRTPEAITVLAGTITMTPGTVSSDLSADGRSLLVHCLDEPDPEAARDAIKRRYETRLKEIFE
ncbi:MAG: Na+/H+ antiporter subunit E [Tistlia sp.]|uniref:Na+/H+ antiporter subunit E n=1 Tax=Tistlia sp. TaxID=3057121 RepID=UPI0034A12C9E